MRVFILEVIADFLLNRKNKFLQTKKFLQELFPHKLFPLKQKVNFPTL